MWLSFRQLSAIFCPTSFSASAAELNRFYLKICTFSAYVVIGISSTNGEKRTTFFPCSQAQKTLQTTEINVTDLVTVNIVQERLLAHQLTAFPFRRGAEAHPSCLQVCLNPIYCHIADLCVPKGQVVVKLSSIHPASSYL